MAVSLAVGPAVAHAQMTAPPIDVPDVPDEPLPEWRPPRPRNDVIHLDLTPEVKRAQDARQAGLWLMSIGGAAMFGGGLLYVHAAGINEDAGKPHTIFIVHDNNSYNSEVSAVFDPRLEDEARLSFNAAVSLLVIGAVSSVAGLISFSIGQANIRKHHKKNPRDPLPPLSGYEQAK